MNKPTLTRSKFSETVLPRNQSNAAWDSAEFHKPVVNYQMDAASVRSAWLAGSKSLSSPLFRTTQGSSLLESLTEPERNSSPQTTEPMPPRVRTAFQIDEDKIERLLKRLRTDKFAGSIDLKHHSQYLEPPKFEIQSGELLRKKPKYATIKSKSVDCFFPDDI